MKRWIVADSILSIGSVGRKQKAGGGSNALRQTSFLSSEAQWSQRAARQQGADNVEAERGGVDVIGTRGDDGEGEGEGKATSFGSNGRTRKRKRRGTSEDAPVGGTGRSMSSRSSSTSGKSSRRKLSRHNQSPSSPIDLFSDDSEGGGQDGDGEGGDDDDFQGDDDDDVGECLL